MSLQVIPKQRRGILIGLVGPAGSGKTSVSEVLRELLGESMVPSISCTSRIPRPGEISGKDYEFIPRNEFLQMVDRGDFFEWEEVHGNLYGTRRSVLTRAREQGQDLLLRIDINGALRVKKEFPQDTIMIFLTPPSWEALEERIRQRGKVDEEEVQRRLATARQEYRLFEESRAMVDYLVVNRVLSETAAQIAGIIQAERSRVVRQIFATS